MKKQKNNRKQLGELLKKITVNFKVIVLLFLLLTSIQAQGHFDLFGKNYEDLTDFLDKKGEYDFSGKCEKSQKIASFLKLNSLYIQFNEGKAIGNGEYLIREASICQSENDTFTYRERPRYIFLEKRQQDDKMILIDTLKMPITVEYSPCLLDFEKDKYAICVGISHIFNNGDQYFEISNIYKVSEKEKLELSPLKTTIYDCQPPGDYEGFMDGGIYTFGVSGGKKLTRYWYKKENQP